MLTFVGLGLYDERSVTRRGADAIAAAERVYLETYTSVLAGASVADLEAANGRSIEPLDRDAIEGAPDPVLDRAEDGDIAVLVAGDPMVATTHVDLRLRAVERGITTRVIHGTSAPTAAAGLCGLQARRFGKATTVPTPGRIVEDGVPPSVWETVDGNRERGLHTLLYLDITLDDAAGLDHDDLAAHCLDAATAAGALAAARPDVLGVAVARAGSDDPRVEAATLETLATRTFGPPLHLLVVPGTLHDMEARALEHLADAPPELVADASA